MKALFYGRTQGDLIVGQKPAVLAARTECFFFFWAGGGSCVGVRWSLLSLIYLYLFSFFSFLLFFSFFLPLSGDGLILDGISEKAVKSKTTNYQPFRDIDSKILEYFLALTLFFLETKW